MPFVQAKLTVKLNESQKESLHSKIEKIIMKDLSKPLNYIMVGIEDNYCLYLAGKKLSSGAMISIQHYGGASERAYDQITAKLSSVLKDELNIDPAGIYITYQRIDNWGFNGSNF